MKNTFYFALTILIIINNLECQQDFGDSSSRGRNNFERFGGRVTFPSITFFTRYSWNGKDVNNNNLNSNSLGLNSRNIYARSTFSYETKERKSQVEWQYTNQQVRTTSKKSNQILLNNRDESVKLKSDFQKNNLKSNWKLDVASEIEKDAGSKSLGKCALYVRKAIQKGKGLKVEPTGIVSAKDYGSFLVKMGYRASKKDYSQANTGDISIFEGNKKHPHGHIQILGSDGKWRSDFKQNNFNPWKDVSNPSYVIYE